MAEKLIDIYKGVILPSEMRDSFQLVDTLLENLNGQANLETTEEQIINYASQLEQIAGSFVQGIEKTCDVDVAGVFKNLTVAARHHGLQGNAPKQLGEMQQGMVIHGAGYDKRRYYILNNSIYETDRSKKLLMMLQRLRAGARTSRHAHNGIEIAVPLTYPIQFSVNDETHTVNPLQGGVRILPGDLHSHTFINPRKGALATMLIVSGFRMTPDVTPSQESTFSNVKRFFDF